MELYADIRNPLRVRDRTELVSKLRELSVDYARLKDESAQIDKEYGAKFGRPRTHLRAFLSSGVKTIRMRRRGLLMMQMGLTLHLMRKITW